MTSLPLPKRKRNALPTVSHQHAPGQERKLAARFGGRVTKASGALDEKGDVRIKGVARIEAKCTQANSFSITQDMLQGIEMAAVGDGELPVIVVDFLDRTGKVKNSVAVMPMYALDDFIARGGS